MSKARPAWRRLWAPVAIVVVAAGMIAVVVFGQDSPDSPSEPPAATAESESAGADAVNRAPGVVGEVVEPDAGARVDVERHDPDDPLSLGPVDAPVTMVMISDFQCGFCALWSVQTLPELLPYVEAEQLRIEWRDIAIFGENSHRAALAAYAAGEQGEYFDFNRELFATGKAPSAQALSDAGLESLAGELGLDLERFNADRASADIAAKVQENIDEAAQLGAFSTPSFLINGAPIVGAQPAEVFLTAVESELADSAGG